MMKQRSKLETKKMVAAEKDCSSKSKAKKVDPANPGKVSYGRKKTLIDSLYQDDDAKKSVMDRAEEVLRSIPVEYPRFSKPMLPSNVSYSFWMIFPLEFCKFHMPKEDVRVVLVDDHGKQRDTTYLTKRHGLSAGWRGFAMDHRLLEGDILVFHMISAYTFKVNIVRVYGLDVANAALILMLIQDSKSRTYNKAKDSSTSRKSEKRVKKLGQFEDQSECDDCSAEVPGVEKYITPKKSKKRVKKLRLIEDHSERQGDDCNADVPEDEGSGITEYKRSEELNHCGTHLVQDHHLNSIGCM
ncbi:B3 domain-containing protein Os01g0234100 isoform X3 [Daucus carota subsp. sativus]|uniref:B3 domain-containing protein Os01g0234100 isoform X3 n=1 Tax=Daucus carota subsp. sativus TaxID=79200 RepID=UPI0007EF8E49|nr:PREDICTED: B3 domain-containing protein Os01g0234100 isoform X2 [Daucus carota subsp. sativus]